MRISGHPIAVLSADEIATIHRNALRILAEMGMEIQNDRLLADLSAVGLPIDQTRHRVYFPSPFVEQFIAEAEKYDWDQAQPTLSVTAGVYDSLYLNPDTGSREPWTEANLAGYFALARALPHIDSAEMLGCRLPVPAELEPLYERYFCWKYGAKEGSSIYRDELCPAIYDLYQFRATGLGKTIKDVFKGTVYLVPPLKLGAHEAYQVDYFRQRGLRVRIGSMHSLGGSAPVTIAGAITLNLAEQLALRILDWAWFGIKCLHIGGSIAVMDLRTTSYRSAPIERPIANLMNAQLAHFYGASFSAHGNLTDAKEPTVEAGMQKAITAVPLLIAGGTIWMPAGLLSADQICSPIQLILDNEMMGALKRFLVEFDVSDESIGIESIFDAGPGGYYFDQAHTARHMRKEIWNPTLWQKTMLQPWIDHGCKRDIDAAGEVIRLLMADFSIQDRQFLDANEEREILNIIDRAKNLIHQ